MRELRESAAINSLIRSLADPVRLNPAHRAHLRRRFFGTELPAYPYRRMMTGIRLTKVKWDGRIVGVQPRIRLTRSFDQRSHDYVGYLLRLEGRIGETAGTVTVGVGPAAHARLQFKVGGVVSGEGMPVADPERETVQLHRVSKLRSQPGVGEPAPPPPWVSIAPPLPVYRERGHRRLAAQTYEKSCLACVWGARMAVTMIIDQWRPEVRRYRFETFCYGPKSCPVYRPGPTRKVPGRHGMSWEEEDWVDADATAHRQADE